MPSHLGRAPGRWLVSLVLGVALGTPSLAFDRDDLNIVLGAIYDNGNPMNDHDILCHGCDLREAPLRDYDMRSADLFESDLTRADLTGSDLTGGDLRYANLTDAILRDTDLTGVDLIGADLTGADLSGARFCNTTMPDGGNRSDGCPP